MSMLSITARPLFGLGVFTALAMLFKSRAVGMWRTALPHAAPCESTEQPTTRNHFSEFFKLLTESSECREWRRREAYLAESTDIYDLEYRMRELDRKDQSKPAWMSGAAG
jgi:hypothetical protein